MLVFPPRTWGSTVPPRRPRTLRELSPTHVGINRIIFPPLTRPDSFPHARGDQPAWHRGINILLGFPPRTWGSTGSELFLCWSQFLSPTHVGINPPITWVCCAMTPFPHARGDQPLTQECEKDDQGFPPRTWGSTPTMRP